MTRKLRSVFILAEAYPDLKADKNFHQLSASLVEIEDNLQYARRYYNGTVRDFNNLVQSFPGLVVARLAGFAAAEFFEIETATERNAPGGETMNAFPKMPAAAKSSLSVWVKAGAIANLPQFLIFNFIFLIFTFSAFAQNERILSFDSDILVRPDSSMSVVETIEVTAAAQQIKHGIYRDFPQLYHGKLGLRVKTGFDVKSVMRDGRPEPFHLEKRDNGVRVYIGSSSVMLPTGNHTYKIVYETDRQLGFFPDHDELYWNATGNAWAFPIDFATATVTLPSGATPHDLVAYTGTQGGRGTNYAAQIRDGKAHFETTHQLHPKQGMTIVVEWPKGFVTQPGVEAQGLSLMSDNKGLTFAVGGLLLVFLYYLIVWAAVGRDPARGTIIPLYGPPEKFSPAAVRYLVQMGFDDQAFTAAILNLAVKGKITIREDGKKQYTLTRTDEDYAGLLSEEKTLLQNLLDRGHPLRLTQTHAGTLQKARTDLQRQLKQSEEEVYFVRNWRYWLPGLIFSVVPLVVSLLDASDIATALFMLVWLTGWTAGVTLLLSQLVSCLRGGYWLKALPLALFATPFVGGEIMGLWFLVHSTSYWVVGLFVASALINGIFYHLMKAPTLAGRKILDQIEGFKMYLSVAEKDRLNLANPPERTPELFEKFLPYALALGVEQKWSEQFTQVLTNATVSEAGANYSPAWYVGTSWATLGAAGFASSLGSSFSTAITSASTPPGSSSGGSSSGGGGGSSGGGGGGGGGGGW